MPKPGYKSITIPQELFDILENRAKEHNQSIPKELETIIKNPSEAAN